MDYQELMAQANDTVMQYIKRTKKNTALKSNTVFGSVLQFIMILLIVLSFSLSMFFLALYFL